jgi:hypothetical protein
VEKHEADLAAKSSTAKFHDMDTLVKAAGLPELFNTPCAEYWENEAEFNYLDSVIFSTDDYGQEWLDFNDETWERLDPVRWTETEESRDLPPAKVKFTLRHQDDFWIWETTYVATLEKFTETTKYVSGVGIVYVCEATYSYKGERATKDKQWKI